ncbi:splicing factor U2AF subunit [Phakopsora pachyrhizi]|uniref:Splicing factor U2AF subunit n=1 Tax=Phakopsora pachyrhizi TaxID=170000 RepID=A0AAV0B2L0_PHAPC|nr:splicing factor U2AF subunit [Phakopsora pachyrhizi]
MTIVRGIGTETETEKGFVTVIEIGIEIETEKGTGIGIETETETETEIGAEIEIETGTGTGIEIEIEKEIEIATATATVMPDGMIQVRPRKYTAWDVKASGYENMSAVEAKISGAFMLPGQTRPIPQAPGSGINGSNGHALGHSMSSFVSYAQPNPNHHWVNPNNPNLNNAHQHPFMHPQHPNQFGAMSSMPRDGSFGVPGALPPIHFKPAQGQSGPVAQTQSFARQARRLYVGNILHTANEMNVAEFFNAKMKELGMMCKNNEDGSAITISENPVVAVQVNHEKNYAFVEFRNAEEATYGMSFDGIIFQNQALKIRRPKDYTGPDVAGPTHIPGVVSTNVPDSPNKIFIGGLPSYLTDDQVMELLKSFGELKSFNLVKDTSSGGHVSKGFAFCEYVDPDITDIACQGLNGMELGDRYLVVQRAQIGQNAKKEKENNPDAAAQRNNHHHINNFGSQAPAAAASVLAAVKSGEGEKTRVLQMLNMVNQEELLDDQEYSEILEDIRDECGKYGTIEGIKIPRPIKNEKGRIDVKASESVDGLGKVFILFSQVTECSSALTAIAGRQFAGRVIICAFAPESIMQESNQEIKPDEPQENEETNIE